MRRHKKCGTKSYSKFLGSITLSVYHCKKCDEIFPKISSNYLHPSVIDQLSQMPEKYLWNLTLVNLFSLIEDSAHRAYPTLGESLAKEFIKRLKEKKDD